MDVNEVDLSFNEAVVDEKLPLRDYGVVSGVLLVLVTIHS